MLSDRVELSSAEARVEGIQGGSVGVFEKNTLCTQGWGFSGNWARSGYRYRFSADPGLPAVTRLPNQGLLESLLEP